jgi:hypothetical protein
LTCSFSIYIEKALDKIQLELSWRVIKD